MIILTKEEGSGNATHVCRPSNSVIRLLIWQFLQHLFRTAVEDGTVTITHNLIQCDEDCTL